MQDRNTEATTNINTNTSKNIQLEIHKYDVCTQESENHVCIFYPLSAKAVIACACFLHKLFSLKLFLFPPDHDDEDDNDECDDNDDDDLRRCG